MQALRMKHDEQWHVLYSHSHDHCVIMIMIFTTITIIIVVIFVILICVIVLVVIMTCESVLQHACLHIQEAMPPHGVEP